MSDFNSYNLSKEILKAIDKLEYKKPSEIQEKVIPILLTGKDIIGTSKTGSGKTAAFAIPICENIDILENNPQALILTPTRELCVQVSEDITNIGRFKKVRCVEIFGKQPVSLQVRKLSQRVHVVAGTPGRTLDLIKRKLLLTDNIKYIVIDEADKMLSMGFFDDVISIVSKLPKNKISLIFSATMSAEIINLSKKYMKNPVRIMVQDENEEKAIRQGLYEVDENEKLPLTKALIYKHNPLSTIIFCNTKDKVDTLEKELKASGFKTLKLHGGMLQKDRLNAMADFKRGKFPILIATDIAARGIDVDSLDLIINYDVPFEKESYVHRIGRTGRAGKSGIALSFVCFYEEKYLKEIEEYVGYEIERFKKPELDEINVYKKEYLSKAHEVKIKKSKSSNFNNEITKVYINAGKKKKIRALDIVGALSNIPGMNAESIGIIDIEEGLTYVDILDGKGDLVINALKEIKIKGKTIKAEKAKL